MEESKIPFTFSYAEMALVEFALDAWRGNTLDNYPAVEDGLPDETDTDYQIGMAMLASIDSVDPKASAFTADQLDTVYAALEYLSAAYDGGDIDEQPKADSAAALMPRVLAAYRG